MPSAVQLVGFEGGKAFEDAMKDLSAATAKNCIRRALTAAALPLVGTATILIKVRAIKDPVQVTKIKFSKGSAGKRAFSQAMQEGATRAEAAQAAHRANAEAKAAGDNDREVTSGTMNIGPIRRAFYGFEFGTIYIAPHPFMRPAWDQHKNQMLQDIRWELWDQIERAQKRAAAKAARIAAKMGKS